MKNVIFDLDMTLVDSSIAESARRQRNWQEVYSLIPSFTLYPGMSEVFDFIRDNNIRVAIVSTSPRLYVERVCQHFNIPTNVILGYHDCGRIKPAPDGMIRALNEIGSSAQDAVSFGDRAIDIQASNAAGITSVACLWGTQERPALVSSNPSEIILSPKGIIALLIRLSNKSQIITEYQSIERNKAELAQLSELKKKYPLGVKEIARENGWPLTKADNVKLLLRIPGSIIAVRQKQEEEAILSDQAKLAPIIMYAKEFAEKNTMIIGKTRITTQYGAKIAAKAIESIKAEDRFKAISSFLDTVKKNQDEFAGISVTQIKYTFKNWGFYTYQFQNRYEDSLGQSKNCSLKVWQAFCEGCCLDDSISYEFYPRYKENRILKTQLEGTYSYNEPTWVKVMAFVSSLKEKYGEELFVILANTDNLNSYAFANNFRTIKEKLSNAGIKYGFKIPEDTSRLSNKTYIVIDIITENSNLIKYCEDIFNLRYGGDTTPDQGQTRVVFVTLLKCYDGSEIEEMNKKKIKAKEEEERKACEEEERKRREAEQKHQDELDIARAETIARSFPIGFKQFFSEQSTVSINAHEARLIIQRESSIKSFQDTISRMNNCVSNWKSARGIPHWFFYYYYPTRYADVSMDSKNARTLIYDFKDGREHDTVKNLVVNKMRSTFSPSDISQMTFVCIPASTRAVHESRYKNFAADVTQALGMANAYDYITIIKEKTPSHLGGSDSAEYSFNPSFFKGKIIVMFDDVVTSGKSVALMKSTMESLGATVICVLSIGHTYSDWNCNPRQPHPQTGRI